MMAARDAGRSLATGRTALSRRSLLTRCQCQRAAARDYSSFTADEELETASGFVTPEVSISDRAAFDPVSRSRARSKQLPSSRYQYRPPKYYRGPLHPHQPPPKWDPSSRVFVPGPFSLPRLQQTYQSTLAPDIMTLAYRHYPPGTRPHEPGQRLREWTGDSPYFKNRPLRKPRGSDTLALFNRPIRFGNVPRITEVTVHSMTKKASQDSSYLHVAGMAIQAITNVRIEPHVAKKTVQEWEHSAGKYVSVTAKMNEEDSLHFLSKTIDLVLPRIKDWKGVRGTTGDGSGNLAFGLTPEHVALYPEIEVNYDMYPPRKIPGCHILIKTSATNDRDARLLLRAMGIPFYGKMVD